MRCVCETAVWRVEARGGHIFEQRGCRVRADEGRGRSVKPAAMRDGETMNALRILERARELDNEGVVKTVKDPLL